MLHLNLFSVKQLNKLELLDRYTDKTGLNLADINILVQ